MIKNLVVLILFPVLVIKPQNLYENIFYPIDNGGFFGYYVTITDTIMLISAHQDNSNGNASGSVYFYKKLDSNWIFIKKITPKDGQPFDFFGRHYLKDDNLFIGAFGWYRPSVYVFNYLNGFWNQTQKITPDHDSLGYGYGWGFGSSITQQGNELFVGAPYDSRYTESSGCVYIYEFIDSVWDRKNILYPKINVSDAHFGKQLDFNIKYNQLIVSAPSDSNDLGFMSGNVYVFQKEDSQWVEKQVLSPTEGDSFQAFGMSIKTEGDYLFIGAPGSSLSNSGGVVYLFKYDGNLWRYINKIIPPINVWRDYFGYSLTKNGDKFLIGSPGESLSGNRRAFTYLYVMLDDDLVLEHVFTPSDTNYFDSFGIGVSMNSDSYLIGAYNANRAYLFTPYPMSINDVVGLLKNYFLFQNYPNPFNPITNIKYSIPKSDIVIIKVYDILGKEITTLLNEYKQAGAYEVNFNASNLPSGVYFYRMISGSYSETKKMILLR